MLVKRGWVDVLEGKGGGGELMWREGGVAVL